MDEKYQAGMKVRRRILGEAHVDKAVENTTPLNREFQDMLTLYGWADVWGRDGFDYRTRRILVLGTMMALGRWEEFVMHLRAALRDNFSLEDIKEIMLQQAEDIKCIGSFENGKMSIEGNCSLQPDIALMDIGLPDISGIECVRTIKQKVPRMDFIMLTVKTDDESVFKSLKVWFFYKTMK